MSSLTLCGIDIPHEEHYSDRCAASRIKSTCMNIYTGSAASFLDNQTLLDKLNMINEAASGIILAVAKNDMHTLSGEKLKNSDISAELNILGALLQNTADSVEETISKRMKESPESQIPTKIRFSIVMLNQQGKMMEHRADQFSR
jgi:hypothetical protein